MSRSLVCLLLTWGAILPGCKPVESPSPGPPNVILIVMDTVSGERCSLNGYARPTTLHLEKLAREGLNFRNAWSPAGWTGPAHASLFTGLRPEHHGFRRGNRNYLKEGAPSLAEILSKEGYRTGCFTNNPIISPDHGLVRGFQTVVPLYSFEDLGYPTAIPTHAMALDWVRESARKRSPFFLFINDMEAHFSYTPPPEFAARFLSSGVSGKDVERANGLTHADLFKHNIGLMPIAPDVVQVLSDLYDGEVACLDQEVGRLVESLGAEGLLDNTILVITSDHGENLGRHGLLEHMASLHRAICHVPLLIRLPGAERAGEAHEEVVRLEDVFPTILEACGLEIPGKIDGETLLGDLGERRSLALMDASPTFLMTMEREIGSRFKFEPVMADISAEFDGRFHRIRYSDGRELVFDVMLDPEELNPLVE